MQGHRRQFLQQEKSFKFENRCKNTRKFTCIATSTYRPSWDADIARRLQKLGGCVRCWPPCNTKISNNHPSADRHWWSQPLQEKIITLQWHAYVGICMFQNLCRINILGFCVFGIYVASFHILVLIENAVGHLGSDKNIWRVFSINSTGYIPV